MKLKELFETFNPSAKFDTQSNWYKSGNDFELIGELKNIKIKIQIEPFIIDGFDEDNTVLNVSFQIQNKDLNWVTDRKTINLSTKETLDLLSCITNTVIIKSTSLIKQFNIIGILIFSKNDTINDNRGKIYQRLASRLRTEILLGYSQRNGKIDNTTYTVLAPPLYLGKLISFIDKRKVQL